MGDVIASLLVVRRCTGCDLAPYLEAKIAVGIPMGRSKFQVGARCLRAS